MQNILEANMTTYVYRVNKRKAACAISTIAVFLSFGTPLTFAMSTPSEAVCDPTCQYKISISIQLAQNALPVSDDESKKKEAKTKKEAEAKDKARSMEQQQRRMEESSPRMRETRPFERMERTAPADMPTGSSSPSTAEQMPSGGSDPPTSRGR
jgi:hypothetical protein